MNGKDFQCVDGHPRGGGDALGQLSVLPEQVGGTAVRPQLLPQTETGAYPVPYRGPAAIRTGGAPCFGGACNGGGGGTDGGIRAGAELDFHDGDGVARAAGIDADFH